MELSKEEQKRLKREAKALKAAKLHQEIVKNLDPNIKITVLCVRFGNKYGREYVERLRNMISRHLTVPYEIVCLTDDQHPIDGVRSIVQPNAQYQKGWWHKIHMFDPSLPLKGRILYFDLDIVICNNIDKLALFSMNQFVGIHDFNRKFYASWKYLNSSVMAWDHGTQNHIYTEFKSKPHEAMRLQGDQDWIWKLCQSKIKFWPKEWIMSYKWEIRSREELTVINGKRQFKEPKDNINIHPDCSIAVFHGEPNPCDVKDKFVIDNWR